MKRIETYSDAYHDDVVELVRNFHADSVNEYDDLFDPEALIATITSMKPENAKNAFLLIVDDVCQGILAGVEYKSLINGKRIFQEVIWYVNEGFRGSGVYLLKHAERLLKYDGISIMIMAVLENSKTKKLKSFYERLGFKPMEVHYVRNL